MAFIHSSFMQGKTPDTSLFLSIRMKPAGLAVAQETVSDGRSDVLPEFVTIEREDVWNCWKRRKILSP